MRLRAVLVVAVLATISLPGCVAEPRAQAIVRDFLLAWQGEQYRKAASYTTGDVETVADALRGAATQLGADEMSFGLGSFRRQGSLARARFTVQVSLLAGRGPRWSYEGRVSLRRGDEGWRVQWSPSVIHPALQPGQRLAVVADQPPRAPILDADGRQLVRPTSVVTIGVRPGAPARNRRAVSALARLVGLDADHAITVVQSAPDNGFVPIVTLRRAEYRRFKPDLSQLAGLRYREHELPLAPAPRFTGEVLGQVGMATSRNLRNGGGAYWPGDNVGMAGLQRAFQRRLAGTADTKVVAQDARGRVVRVLARWPGQTPKPVHTTLDRHIQAAAGKALARVHRPASLVAVDSSTGDILAVANRGFDDSAAFTGHFPPGEVFELVSSAALLQTGLAVDARIPCPPRRIVGGEVFRNSSHSAGARAPAFRVSFATSCSTAFVGLARRLPDTALTATAARLGVGGAWSLPVNAFTGLLPPPRNDAHKAAYMIGDGPVRMSPLGMALVAAAVDSGTWRPPRLVTEPAAGTITERPLPKGNARALRMLMRSSVESGTASAADLPGGQVYGMAGEATKGSGSNERTYAWFVGFRGDVAFALVLPGSANQVRAAAGPGGRAAAAVSAHFLHAVAHGRG